MTVPSSEFRVPSGGREPGPSTLRDTTLVRARNSELGTRNCFAVLLALLVIAGPVSAQHRADSLLRRPSPFPVKYGKWVLLAASIGMGLKAADAHQDADRAYDRLQSYCRNSPTGCPQTSSGSYFDPVAEGHYKSSLSHDRRARNWLFGGEAAFLGAAGLFVWELTRPRALPRNIPFEPEIRWTGRATQVGVRAAF